MFIVDSDGGYLFIEPHIHNILQWFGKGRREGTPKGWHHMFQILKNTLGLIAPIDGGIAKHGYRSQY